MATAERSPAEILRAAKERIVPANAWITGNYAQDQRGKGVEPNDPSAVCFCVIGALLAEEGLCADDGDKLGRPTMDALAAACRFLGGNEALASFNDKADHGTVEALFDRAIELAGAS